MMMTTTSFRFVMVKASVNQINFLRHTSQVCCSGQLSFTNHHDCFHFILQQTKKSLLEQHTIHLIEFSLTTYPNKIYFHQGFYIKCTFIQVNTIITGNKSSDVVYYKQACLYYKSTIHCLTLTFYILSRKIFYIDVVKS